MDRIVVIVSLKLLRTMTAKQKLINGNDHIEVHVEEGVMNIKGLDNGERAEMFVTNHPKSGVFTGTYSTKSLDVLNRIRVDDMPITLHLLESGMNVEFYLN